MLSLIPKRSEWYKAKVPSISNPVKFIHAVAEAERVTQSTSQEITTNAPAPLPGTYHDETNTDPVDSLDVSMDTSASAAIPEES